MNKNELTKTPKTPARNLKKSCLISLELYNVADKLLPNRSLLC